MNNEVCHFKVGSGWRMLPDGSFEKFDPGALIDLSLPRDESPVTIGQNCKVVAVDYINGVVTLEAT